MSDYGKFKVDIPQATNLRQELSAQTNIIVEESTKAQGSMEEMNGTNDPIMRTIGRIGNMYGQFASRMKDFQAKADGELNNTIQTYTTTLNESQQLLDDAEKRYREF